jgi:hypothetical protein
MMEAQLWCDSSTPWQGSFSLLFQLQDIVAGILEARPRKRALRIPGQRRIMPELQVYYLLSAYRRGSDRKKHLHCFEWMNRLTLFLETSETTHDGSNRLVVSRPQLLVA